MSGSCSVSSSAVTDELMKHCYSIYFLCFILNVSVVLAQGSTSIKASVDKNRILIGEPLQLTIEAKFDKKDGLRTLPVDSIPHFEELEKPSIDSVIKSDGIVIRGIYKLTSFDSGHWVIPSFSLSKKVKSDTIPIDVVFSEFDPKQDYHDIKDILEEEPPKKKYTWWWYMLAVVVLVMTAVLYLLKKKKPAPVITVRTTVNPYEEAMRQLAQLKYKKLSGKELHSSLTDIFRLYLYSRKGILSLQKTTDELVIQLKETGMEKEQFDKLSQSLRLSDFVKFARYNPSVSDDDTCYEEIHKAIKTIEQMEIKVTIKGH